MELHRAKSSDWNGRCISQNTEKLRQAEKSEKSKD